MSPEARAEVGIVGGTGLYALSGLRDPEEITVETPFGAPSSPLVLGSLGSRRVAFLARHGRGHGLLPTEIPYRANVYALKALGVRQVLSVSAVGSLREDLPPRRIVVLDQGSIVEEGSHDDLLARDGVYARLLRLQMLDTVPTERVAAPTAPSL